nr:type II and III secretion system protein [Kiritimatiellia bacterium]
KFGRDYSSETGYNTEKGDDGKTSKTPTDNTSDKATFLSDIANDITRGNSWAHNWSGGAHAKVDGVQATINLLKLNGAAKSLYSTTLSTQSGIEAEFQSGGTFNIMTTPGMASNGDMVSIEYGYIIKTTPLIIDANTVNLDFSLDNKEPLDNTGTQISRYQTKSKYLVRPGESIAISGYRHNSESEDKKGTPWLSKIPWIGPYLFGNTANKMELQDMLLVVTVNWALEDDGGATAARLDEMKNRKVEVEMP